VALLVLVALLLPGSAAAGNKKLVEGTVYDTTCATSCLPECPTPPCGPIPAGRPSAAIVCAQRIVACPLYGSPRICLPSSNCGGYPIYSGEGATVNVRRRGSSTVLATLPVVEGHFSIRLGAGEYVLHPRPPEEPCWSGSPTPLNVPRQAKSPLQAVLGVADSCVAHPDS
jgi:hypothetical protein